MEHREFGHYRLEHLIGSGGMGDVYRAFDLRRERAVALKLLPELFSGDQEFQQRFRRESKVVARLRDPHIIPIHDYGEIDNRLYIDMRLVDGGANVASVLRDEGVLPAARAVRIIAQVAEALDAAHQDGLIHRDVKPSNILVTSHDFAYVVDFGIAHAIGHTASSLTMTGTTVGTLDYMAPERFSNLPVDRRADVYSLACVFYECLTASKPFVGADLPALMYAHLYTAPPAPSMVNPAVPAAMDEVIAFGMAKNAEDRYPTAGALAEAARAALGEHRETRPGRDHHEPPAGQPTRRVARPLVGGTPASRSAKTQADPTADHPEDWPGPERPSGSSVEPDTPASAAPEPVAPEPVKPEPAAPEPAPPPTRIPAPPGDGLDFTRRPPDTAPRRAVFLVAAGVLVLLLVGVLLAVRGPGAPTAPAPRARPAPARTIPGPKASLAVPATVGSIPIGATPGYATVAPDGRFAYVTNRGTQVVTVLNTATGAVAATIPIPQGPPRFLTLTPDGTKAYLSIYNDQDSVNLVAVLDTATHTVLGTIPVDKRPFALALSPDQRTLWVPSHDTATIDVIDTARDAIVKRIPVAPNPHWVGFGSGRAYVANHESNLLTVLDSSTGAVLTTIRVGTSPHSVAVSPDGHRVSVVNYDSNDVSVIDPASNRVIATVPVGLNPQDIVYAPDGRHAYTADVGDDTVSVIDTTTDVVTATVHVGRSPTSVALLPDGSRGYVTCLDDAALTELDTAH